MGKSLVTSLLAVLMRRKGYRSTILMLILPAPPSLKLLYEAVAVSERGLSVKSRSGIDIISINMLLPNETDLLCGGDL